MNCLRTNDIAAMRQLYGVEACRASIIEQITAVFGVYGIAVDERHLGLIADYMTYEGGFRALNRIGLGNHGSPMTQVRRR